MKELVDKMGAGPVGANLFIVLILHMIIMMLTVSNQR